MSSVGSSDSSNSSNRQDEVVRRNREDYRGKESELVKKQAKELRRMSEEHYKELERVKESHAAQMNELRKNSSQEMSRRDLEHQQDIKELRDLYKKNLQGQTEETQRREAALRDAMNQGLNQSKNQGKNRETQINQDHRKTLNEQGQRYQEALDQSRMAQKEAIDKNRQKLEQSYAEQIKVLNESRSEQVGGLQKSYDEYRSTTTQQRRDQDLRHMQDQQRASDALLSAVRRERQLHQQNSEALREGFDAGLEKTRAEFEKAASREREAQSHGRDQLRGDVMDRIGNQVRRLENENQQLKDANALDRLRIQNSKEKEVSNMRDAFGRNVQALEAQRDAAVRNNNELGRKDIENVRRDLEGQLVQNNRFFREKMDERNRISNSAYENLKLESEVGKIQTKSVADQRVKQVMEAVQEETVRRTIQDAEAHKLNQASHQDEMKALRAELEEDKRVAVSSLQTRIQNQELKHSEQMSQVVQKYEKQITSLQDQILRDKKNADENLKRTIEDMERNHKLVVDKLELQSRERLRQANNQHGEELRMVNRRNDEKMDQVLTEIKRG